MIRFRPLPRPLTAALGADASAATDDDYED